MGLKISKKARYGLIFTALLVSMVSFAQDDDLPFEDFPDLESTDGGAGATSGGAQNAADMAEAQEELNEAQDEIGESASQQQTAAVEDEEEELISDKALEEEFDEMTSEEKVAADSQAEESLEDPEPSRGQVLSRQQGNPGSQSDQQADQMRVTSPGPSAPSPLLAQPTNAEDFNSNQDEGFMENPMGMPEDIQALENRLKQAEQLQSGAQSQALSDEPGSQLPPSEKFWRVPIRPQMSDANWLRWMGPLVDKEYNVHRGDSLWKVSERLFGTPFLWPKIWHLNASITNPHIISKGMKLDFKPGNPGSAPELAYKANAADTSNLSLYPLTKLAKKKTLLEIIDSTLREQIRASHPPFQYFLLYSRPDNIGEIPRLFNSSGKIFYQEGDSFKTTLADGIFPIVKVDPINVEFSTYYRVNWLGTLKIERNRATVVKAFREIRAGDLIVNRSFQLTPLAIHEDTIGPEARKETKLVALQEGADVHTAEYGLMGIRFPAIGVGPRPGALLTVNVGNSAKARALLIDRDQRTGTIWIVTSEEEVDVEDALF